MASVYQIKYTDGIRTITIQPGTLNGPGGVLSNTDLQLYGQGTLAWGAGVDQNLLRLIENFACPESLLVPGMPMGDAEIGVVGAGINSPNEGQQWFNTTDQKLYLYDGSVFVPGGSVVSGGAASEPTSPVIGTLWYDTDVPQLKVYDGVSFESVAVRYLQLDGLTTMTGALDMGTNLINDVVDPVSLQDAATKNYVDTELAAAGISGTAQFVDVIGDKMTGDLEIERVDPHLTLDALATSDARVILQDTGSNRGDFKLDLPSDDVSIRRLTGGEVVTNELTFKSDHISTIATANGKIRTPATSAPDNSLTVTTKGYVDTEITNATANGAVVFTSLANAGIGDIAVTGGKIYINLAAGVNWKQVWPAIYS